ncbi:histidine phosphatase family protein [Amycolatopsis rhabdoformis]|uniref:Histidine phosphatase family protein n=1 Tax=Amycolatopsis rhabdoformis TaxID=1448059 RepID=A0ABZ1IAJ8_9PSEU|nr:histidine phosphatase family protein [Amycolatopsis rhabdoformis]WSE31445.1 histidine phosphatase family protein [Amycolatopsis rhabdoformis]
MTTRLDWVGLVRHGQSTGNVAREVAEAAGHEVIDIAERDADVPLTALGERQARAVGEWLAADPPDLVVASTYRRALDTARLALAVAAERGVTVAGGLRVDERVRDRELGVLDLLTSHGVAERWPDELRRKQRLGKFYYRPPGGESWADVVLRVRSLLAELGAEHSAPARRVVFVAHEMTVFALRYVLESVSEQDLLATAVRTDVPHGSVTAWQRDGSGAFHLTLEQATGHLTALPG